MKTSIRKALALVVAFAMAGATLFSQEMSSLMFRKPVKSPEVTAEGVTFRFKGQKARMVQVSASCAIRRMCSSRETAQDI